MPNYRKPHRKDLQQRFAGLHTLGLGGSANLIGKTTKKELGPSYQAPKSTDDRREVFRQYAELQYVGIVIRYYGLNEIKTTSQHLRAKLTDWN